MQDTEILVTGGAGFIGSNLANYWSKENDVTVIDDLSLGDADNLNESVDFIEQSVLDVDLPTDVDFIAHLAARSSYQMHEDDPTTGAAVNVEGFVNVVEQAREDGCDQIVYATTSSIYGNRTEPSPETMDVTANTAYEASKLARERYAEYFTRHYDMTLAGLRYFSVYEGYRGAEEHKGSYANVIAQFTDDIANDRRPTIFGDGTQSRDFTHINDVVYATNEIAENRLCGIYNVGTGEQYNFNEVVNMINEELGKDATPEYIDNPIPEEVYVFHTLADLTKIESDTGWTPSISLREGISRVCEPYQ